MKVEIDILKCLEHGRNLATLSNIKEVSLKKNPDIYGDVYIIDDPYQEAFFRGFFSFDGGYNITEWGDWVVIGSDTYPIFFKEKKDG